MEQARSVEDERGTAARGPFAGKMRGARLKRAREELEQGERRRAAIVEAALDAVISVDATGGIVEFNTAAERMFGWSQAEALGGRVGELLVPPAELPMRAERFRRLFQLPEGQTTGAPVELTLLHKDGTPLPVSTRAAKTTIKGEPVLTAFFHDLSPEGRVKEARRESEQRFRRLAENAPDVIFRYRLRPEPAVEYVNAFVEQISRGFSPEDFYADPALLWSLVHPEDAALLEEGLRSGRPSSLLARWRRKDGKWIWAEVRSVPVFDERGELLAYEGILRDVTEHERAREERERNFELLRRADEERARLLNRLVHAQEEERRRIAQDLHDDSIQVLTVLAMRLELLAETLEDPVVLSQLEEAKQTARSVISGLRSLLFELDPPVLRREGLAAAIAEQLEIIRQQTGAEVRLESTLTAELRFETAAIAYRIAQEALVNARKHAQATQIIVQIEGAEEGLTVRVADNGCGFETMPEQRGHLGLISMSERAEMAAGRWQVDSVPGSGTTVEFYLPLRGTAPG